MKATAGRQTAQASATVTVSNGAAAPAPVQLAIVSQSIADGAALSGSVTWSVTTTGDVRRVDFLVDGRRAGSLWRAPWQGTLDTTQLANGTHTLAVKVTGRDGTVVQAQVSVTVAD